MSYFIIQRPNEASRRKSFAISERIGMHFKSVKSDVLSSINGSYLRGLISEGEAFIRVKELVRRLYGDRDKHKPCVVHMPINLRIIGEYWKEVYSDKDLIDSKTMQYDLKRAVGALGNLSLISANKQELQTAINRHYKDKPNLQRRAVTRVNQLLKFLNRGFQLNKVREVSEQVVYINLLQLPVITIPFNILCWVAITTGLRLGEIFAITEASVNWSKHYVNVTHQIDIDLKRRHTKTRRSRKAILLPEGVEWLRRWLDLSDQDRHELRHINHARRLSDTLKRPIKFHDLRHSYAIHLLSKEVPLSLVAQSLGNSHKVCEKYYTGFVLAEESIDTVNRILRSDAEVSD